MTKMTWQAPRIESMTLPSLNKFGRRRLAADAQSAIDGVSVETLVERYGSPLYVTSESRLRANIRRITQAFSSRYPKVIHGWSYKTNYNGAVCSILHQEGSWAEVVSRFEYEKARALGVPGDRIVFNGPNKPRPILERAIAEGALIHVDHADELALIEAIAEERRERVPVTLRLNFKTGYSEPWSRFGFNLESGAARAAIKRVKGSRHLRLNGLHSHIGTFILDPRAYAAAASTLCMLAREIEADGTRLSYIDIGGGLPSNNALQGIYLPPEQSTPDLDEYAEAICRAFLDGTAYRLENGEERPALVFESGRAVIDDAQSLITSVVGRKETADGRPAAILDAGLNALFTALWYDHPVRLASPARGELRDTVLYGPLCMNIDVLRHSVQLPPLAVGDRLVIAPVGAYNTTQSMQFIEYRPAVVLIHGDREVSLIRAAEDLEVVCAQERLPAHLAPAARQTAAPVPALRVAGG
ncbi:Diaminopimelate decarboxylase [Candidatus Accumulibacter aalborgensis]|uniref:Diaminopimelate decarboxylase n=1 Tax=Candidatus Accumulibacter aalborgensis TaxID=1860102 RepID=A0A1A8XXK9_9PROT|nr:alanine racemase [Candidatus Accumulibacter aalborgensis]SBT09700.1 Diaminopimelate decarboxylase [Candidatus Accumulibacter aalborgensis]